MQGFSLHRVMTLTVLGLGLLGVLLVFGAGVAYRQLAHENKSAAIAELLRINTPLELERTYEIAADLGHSIQAETHVKTGASNGSRQALVEELNQHFHRYFVTSNLLTLEQLHVFDASYNLIASAGTTDDSNLAEARYCENALNNAKRRAGADRLRTVTALCTVDHRPVISVIVPLGGLKPVGYLVVVADPVTNLAHLEPTLGVPVRLRSDDGKVLYRSDAWPADDANEHILIGGYDILNSTKDGVALRVEAAEDVTAFHQQLLKAQYVIFVASIVLVLIGLAVAIKVLRRGVDDLQQLQDAAEALTEGRFKTLRNAHYPEVRALTKSFNRMSLQIRMHHDHLNELVTIRTRELEVANAKLGADIDRQKEVDKMKDEFIAMINHEMRTPVTAIKGALDLIECGKLAELPTPLKSLVGIGRSNCGRLLRLINDVLNVQHLEAGSFTFNMKPTLLAPVVRYATETTQPFADTYDVKFRFTDKLPGVHVRIDPDRAVQVFTNLLSNAAKYTRPGDQVEITIDQHRNFARVSVVDHGPGIPEGFRQNVFSKFSQANASDTRSTGSSGLGLYVTKSLVTGMNGAIAFETEENKGTVFYVDFPVAPPAAEQTEQESTTNDAVALEDQH